MRISTNFNLMPQKQISFGSKFLDQQKVRNEKSTVGYLNSTARLVGNTNEVNSKISELKNITTKDQFGNEHNGCDFLQTISEINSMLPCEERQSGVQFHELFNTIYNDSTNNITSNSKKVCDAFWSDKDLVKAEAFVKKLEKTGVIEIKPLFIIMKGCLDELRITTLGRGVLEALKTQGNKDHGKNCPCCYL